MARARLFVSYSRKDSEFSEELRDALQAHGLEVCVDTHDIAPGENWRERLGRLIESADIVLFVLSPDAVSSTVCDWEVRCAERLGKRILPVLHRDVDSDRVPEHLTRLHYLFMRTDAEKVSSLPRLLNAVESDIAWIRQSTNYLEKASEWDRAGRPRRLLLRGESIGQAEQWRDSRPSTAEVGALCAEFVSSSRNAQALRLKWAVSGALLVAVLAGSLAIIAYTQRNEARRQRDEATRQQLVATARALSSQTSLEVGDSRNDEKAALLARQAFIFDQRSGGTSEALVFAGLQRVPSLPRRATEIAWPGTSLLRVSDDLNFALAENGGRRDCRPDSPPVRPNSNLDPFQYIGRRDWQLRVRSACATASVPERPSPHIV